MFIVIFLFFISNLCASQTLDETLAQAQADYRVNLAQKKVMDAQYALVSAQLDKRSEEEIKKHETAVVDAATDMLLMLGDLKEACIRPIDIDFCLAYKPDLNRIDKVFLSPTIFNYVFGKLSEDDEMNEKDGEGDDEGDEEES